MGDLTGLSLLLLLTLFLGGPWEFIGPSPGVIDCPVVVPLELDQPGPAHVYYYTISICLLYL